MVCCLSLGFACEAQQNSGVVVPAGTAIDDALRASSLTFEGKPFHAVMEIDEPKHPGGIYKAGVEVYWAGPRQYKLIATSRDFSQSLIVNGDQEEETDRGDFYPAWLREFVSALLDPAPRAKEAALRAGTVKAPNGMMPNANLATNPKLALFHPQACAVRDERRNGIGNEITESEICFDWPEHRLTNVQAFDYGMGFADPISFQKKQIASRYTVMVSTIPADEYIDFIVGHLVTLKPLGRVDGDMFTVKNPTPPSGRIFTRLVSTREEEAMLEKAPEMDWPPVTHGVTEGYLIVHAVTDKTGQVRSAWQKSADNGAMVGYAIQQALKYKFHPLIVDGVAMQMEMPLVMHFTSRLDDSIPRFNGDTLNQIVAGCTPAILPTGSMPSGTSFKALVFVDPQGRVAGIDYAKDVPDAMRQAANRGLYDCHFKPYAINGVPTVYHAEFTFYVP